MGAYGAAGTGRLRDLSTLRTPAGVQAHTAREALDATPPPVGCAGSCQWGFDSPHPLSRARPFLSVHSVPRAQARKQAAPALVFQLAAAWSITEVLDATA